MIATLLAGQGAVTLLYQPKVGASYQFSVSSTASSSMGQSSFNAKSTIKILSFKNGYYQVQTVVSNTKTSGTGSSAAPSESKTILDYDKFGAVKFDKNRNDGAQQLMSSFSNQTLGMQFPHKPVKVGDTWQNTVDMGGLAAALVKSGSEKPHGKLTLTFKLVQVTAKNATVSCGVKGSMTMMVTPAAKKGGKKVEVVTSFSGNGQYSIERSTGVYLASNMKLQVDTAANGQHFVAGQSVSMKRI